MHDQLDPSTSMATGFSVKFLIDRPSERLICKTRIATMAAQIGFATVVGCSPGKDDLPSPDELCASLDAGDFCVDADNSLCVRVVCATGPTTPQASCPDGPSGDVYSVRTIWNVLFEEADRCTNDYKSQWTVAECSADSGASEDSVELTVGCFPFADRL